MGFLGARPCGGGWAPRVVRMIAPPRFPACAGAVDGVVTGGVDGGGAGGARLRRPSRRRRRQSQPLSRSKKDI